MSTPSPQYNNYLKGFQGNSKDVFCAVKDSSGDIYNLSGYNAYFYMQKYPIRDSNPIDVSISSHFIDASAGVAYFSLTESDLDLNAGDYVYEVQIDNGAGILITVVQDRFNLQKSLI